MGLCNILPEMERGRGRGVTGSRDTVAPTHRRQAQIARATLPTHCEEISTGVKGMGASSSSSETRRPEHSEGRAVCHSPHTSKAHGSLSLVTRGKEARGRGSWPTAMTSTSLKTA